MTGPGLPPTAKCMHGDHIIALQPGTGVWLDADGMTTCVKAPLDSILTGNGLVLHQPLPDLGGDDA